MYPGDVARLCPTARERCEASVWTRMVTLSPLAYVALSVGVGLAFGTLLQKGGLCLSLLHI